VPDSTAMRRAASAALVALALSLTTVACGSAKATPGVPKANFTPGAVLSFEPPHGCSSGNSTSTTPASCTPEMAINTPGSGGGEVTPSGSSDITSVKSGTVLEISNSSSEDQRIQGSIDGTQTFDTGTLKPAESTTVVLDTSGKLTITDVGSGQKVTLVVEPKPGQKT